MDHMILLLGKHPEYSGLKILLFLILSTLNPKNVKFNWKNNCFIYLIFNELHPSRVLWIGTHNFIM